MSVKSKTSSHARRKDITDTDWERAEREYRTGQLTVAEIARLVGCSDQAVRMRAKKFGWTRDLSAQVRARAHRLATLLGDDESVDEASVKHGVPEELLVEEAAKRGAKVLYQHRLDVARGRGLVEKMFSELTDSCANPQLLEELASQVLDEESADNRRRAAVNRAVSLTGRASTLKDLALSLSKLVTLERQAHNLNDKESDTPGELAEALERAKRRVKNLEQGAEDAEMS